MRHRYNINTKRGSTLVEALVACSLLALLVIFVIRPLSVADRATAQVAGRRAALGLAYELMDQAQLADSHVHGNMKGTRTLTYATSTGQQAVECQWVCNVTELQEGCYSLKIEVSLPTGRPITLESAKLCLEEAHS